MCYNFEKREVIKIGEEKNVPVEKKAISKTNTWLQVKEKEDKLKKIEDEIENAKKLKKEIKREISQGKIRVVRAEERRLDAVVGVAIRWASYADTKLQKRLMEILDEFYFDDRNRSFLGFDLFPAEKKNECEKARESERKRRKESSGKDTNTVRITKTPQPINPDPIFETPPTPAGESKDKVELTSSTEKPVEQNSGKETEPEKCPQCEEGVIVMKHRKSDNAPFWGCSEFPKCRYVKNYTD